MAKTRTDLARELLDKMPDIPSKQAGRILYSKNKGLFKNEEAARSTVRGIRGAHTAAQRRIKVTHPREKKAPGWMPPFPPSDAKDWTPLELPTPCRVLSLSDAHVPYHDSAAIEAAVSYARKSFEPDIVLLNGDWADFHAISRWEKDPSMRNYPSECGVVEESLSWLRSAFPKARIIYKKGNHEERLEKYLWLKAPELWGLPQLMMDQILHLEKYGVELIGDQRIIMCGKLPVLHGHEFRSGISAPVNPARGLYLRLAHTALIGHLHRSSTHAEPDLFGSETVCWSQGCLCDVHPPYSRVGNKWNVGFATVDVFKDGKFDLRNFKIAKGGEVRSV